MKKNKTGTNRNQRREIKFLEVIYRWYFPTQFSIFLVWVSYTFVCYYSVICSYSCNLSNVKSHRFTTLNVSSLLKQNVYSFCLRIGIGMTRIWVYNGKTEKGRNSYCIHSLLWLLTLRWRTFRCFYSNDLKLRPFSIHSVSQVTKKLMQKGYSTPSFSLMTPLTSVWLDYVINV